LVERGYGRKQRDRARNFRQDATDAERKLWSLLRRKRMNVRFRRQQPISPYVADFFCPSAALVIELDGSQHADESELLHDAKRTKWLEANGYRVLRFWNADVLKTPCVVRVLDGAPLPENRAP
jgi:very-short-patch-repair endonuclease